MSANNDSLFAPPTPEELAATAHLDAPAPVSTQQQSQPPAAPPVGRSPLAPPTADELAATAHLDAPPEESYTQKAVNALPTIGGMVGGGIGMAGALGTGGLGFMAPEIMAAGGGALGEGAKQMLNKYVMHSGDSQDLSSADIATDALTEGAKQGAFQLVGGRLVGPMLSKVAEPIINATVKPAAEGISSAIGNLAGKLGMKATGLTGAQALKAAANAGMGADAQGMSDLGNELMDRGLLGRFFGKTQHGIADAASSALDQSGEEIGQALNQLDARGVGVQNADVITALRQRAAQYDSMDGASIDIGKRISALADQLEERAQAAGALNKDSPLSFLENQKKDWANKATYNPLDPTDASSAKEIASVYRDLVESTATQADPALSGLFKQAKEDYGLLEPVASGSQKRAAQFAQKQGVNTHSIGTTTLGALLGGEEGYRHGGIEGAVAGGIAGGVIGPRVLSTSALGTRALGNAVAAVPTMVSNGVGNAAVQFTADKLSSLVRTDPSQLGQFAPVLQKAAERGDTALAAANHTLWQTDADYRAQMKKLSGDDK